MEYIEVSAKSVTEAITKASLQLETSSDNLEIQVISEGSSGFLGIGSKPAVIRVRKKPEVQEELISEEVAVPEEKEKVIPKKETVQENSKRDEDDVEVMKQVAQEFLTQVFEAMQLDAAIQMEYDKKDECLNIEFTGEDMGILIGKRGQTLDSLQYLTNLVVNKGRQEYIRVKLDTENYRKRRKETLENLAKNIAYKVKKTRKSVSLEPMNPYERRIIHSALQDNKFVETYSEGNEPYRHVVVALKKNNRDR